MNMLLEIIREIHCLMWAVVVLVALYMVATRFVLPLIQLCHERKMKSDAFEREKKWKDLEECQIKLEEKYSKQIAGLEKEKADLESKLEALKNWNELMQSTQKTYLELYKKLESEVKPKQS